MSADLPKDLLRQLGDATADGSSGLLNAYADNFRAIHSLSSNRLLRRGRLKSKARDQVLIDQVKASAILNDLSFLNLEGGKDLRMLWIQPEGHSRIFGTDKITISVSQEQFERIDGQGVALGFSIRNDSETESFKELAPLISAGHLVIQPSRIALYVAEQHPDGSRTFNVLDVDERTPIHQWVTSSDKIDASFDIDAVDRPHESDQSVTDVLLPFITGTTTSDLVKIMADEADLLTEFRSSIRELTEDARKKGHDTQGILHDVVNPRIAKLQRRFEQIARMNRLKAGGAAVATATLALTSVMTGGLVAGVTALAGSTGLLMVTKELITGVSDLNALKDDPTYFLWKLRRGPGIT